MEALLSQHCTVHTTNCRKMFSALCPAQHCPHSLFVLRGNPCRAIPRRSAARTATPLSPHHTRCMSNSLDACCRSLLYVSRARQHITASAHRCEQFPCFKSYSTGCRTGIRTPVSASRARRPTTRRSGNVNEKGAFARHYYTTFFPPFYPNVNVNAKRPASSTRISSRCSPYASRRSTRL